MAWIEHLDRSGDIRDQSLKFSEIVTPHVEKSRKITPTGPKVITANTLNSKPFLNVNF